MDSVGRMILDVMCGVAHLGCGLAHLWRGVFIVVWRSSLGCVEAHMGCGVMHCDVAYSSFAVWRSSLGAT